jgi:RNA polymerase sigma factor (sigma-70 family)
MGWMGRVDRRTDADLLHAAFEDRGAFAVFYARFERPVAGFFVRATGSGELAADLTAEAFAQALESAARFDPALGTAQAWLFGIARHVLSRSRERGRVEDQARRRLGMPPLALDDDAIGRIERAGSDDRAAELLDGLPEDQREAVVARVVGERGYGEIASELQCSESVVRKRVSRGLATMRLRLKEEP